MATLPPEPLSDPESLRAALMDNGAPPERPPRPRRRKGWSVRLTCSGVFLLAFLNLVVLALVGWPLIQMRLGLIPSPTGLPAPDLTTTPTAPPTSTETFTPTPSLSPLPPQDSPVPLSDLTLRGGVIILALREGVHTHLFAYQPEKLPLTRLTSGDWEDTAPALSPDGRWVAFSSDRNGYWDVYLLDLPSGEIQQVTESPEYDGAPSWSPDSLWLSYESYLDNNLEIMIAPADASQAPIRLTTDAAADFSPAWSPLGRQIAFVSNRSGENEIWIASLDVPGEDRYTNISQDARTTESHPAWSPDGMHLAWAAQKGGYHGLFLWRSDQPQNPPLAVGSGDWPLFSPDGGQILALLNDPYRSYLTAYEATAPGLALSPLALPGAVGGLSWRDVNLPWPLPEPYRAAIALTPTPLWVAQLAPSTPSPGGRENVVALPADVDAPHPMLLDEVDEAFVALRDHLGTDLGWDFLGSLENAYLPLTSALDPGLGADWLFTGRAFTVNTLPINAGWMVVVREDYGEDTYWRIYLRTRFQDGSAGAPLHDFPWDFNARFSGDTVAYETGGERLKAAPSGYWIDFSAYAAAYGWERLPALVMWRSAYPQARFNAFVQTGGLEWRDAMLQLYPPDVLVTPTIVVPPTRTLTPTPRWYQTPTPTLTDTPRPTYTPVTPSATPSATPTSAPRTPTPTRRTRTPFPTRTPTPTVTGTP